MLTTLAVTTRLFSLERPHLPNLVQTCVQLPDGAKLTVKGPPFPARLAFALDTKIICLVLNA